MAGMPEGAAGAGGANRELDREARGRSAEEAIAQAASKRRSLREAPVEDGPVREINFYQVQFRPHREMFSSGTNPIMLLRNLAALGTVSVCQLHAEELPLVGAA